MIKLNKKHGNIFQQFVFYTLDASNINKITEITDNFSIIYSSKKITDENRSDLC
jgi:hypothetical protein